jgi:hypothetical protein
MITDVNDVNKNWAKNLAGGTREHTLGSGPIFEEDQIPESPFMNGTDIIALDNPAISNVDDQTGLPESEVMPYINPYKVCELLFSGPVRAATYNGYSLEETNPGWGSWRIKNGAGIAVHPRVLLFLDTPKLGYSFTHSFEKAWEGLKEKSMLKKVEGALEIARLVAGTTSGPRGGRFMSAFANVPAWKSTTGIKFDGEVKFNFKYGQAGLFSGEHEVVRPIIAIVSQFGLGVGGAYVTGPAPTMESYFVKMMESMAGGGIQDILNAISAAGADILSAALDKSKGPGAATILIKAATNVQATVYNAINAGIAAGAAGVRTFRIRIGRAVAGPFYAQNVSWNFDFSQTDEFGFPYAGSVSISGLEMLSFPTSGQFMSTFNAALTDAAQTGSSIGGKDLNSQQTKGIISIGFGAESLYNITQSLNDTVEIATDAIEQMADNILPGKAK